MISSLITSNTRIKLLKKFFLNSNVRAHLRGLETEFGESSNSIRIELNRLERAGLLGSAREGNKKVFQANTTHPLFHDIHNIMIKETGIDQVVDRVISRIGELLCVYLTGDFAQGRDSEVIDLILVGENIDRAYLSRIISKAEQVVRRRVKCVVLEPADATEHLSKINQNNTILLWYRQENAVFSGVDHSLKSM
jgi:hypothetical protein